jgi:tRNA U38,U39,U40 pseudouridine synthase TruA
MIGVMIQVFRGGLDDKFIPNTQRDNVVNVALAPGDGLLLERVSYDKYNAFKKEKKNDIMIKSVT